MQTRKFQTLIFLLLLTACDQNEDRSTAEYLGKFSAGLMLPIVHTAYLNCYALNKEAKSECLKELATKYISDSRKNDEEYITAFEFESEKLGFKHFLNNHELPCEEVVGGPMFSATHKAYIVTCKPNQEYRMHFNYSTKEWQLLEKNT